LSGSFSVCRKQTGRQQKRPQSPVSLTPIVQRDSPLWSSDLRGPNKSFVTTPFDLSRGTAEAIAVEQPGVFGDFRKELLAKRHNAHTIEMLA
jgi:hypothetical protein